MKYAFTGRVWGICAVAAMMAVLGGCSKKKAADEAKTEEVATEQPMGASMAGTYAADMPTADAPGRRLTMMLHADNTAMMSTDDMNGQPAATQMGTWAAGAAAKSVDVTFQMQSGDTTAAMTMNFVASGDTLSLTNGAQAGMGAMGMKLVKQPEAGQ